MNDQITTNEIMDFLKEHLVMRDEIRDIVREETGATKTEIVEHVDRFAKLHETLDQELVMLRSKYNRLEERLEIVETRLGIAA
ncbi:MAG TPA: hypothetical protein VJB64_04005 [Patescibacteria group bacterium]|nr:hypothetical protein [Patescibacteria group bacterium]